MANGSQKTQNKRTATQQFLANPFAPLLSFLANAGDQRLTGQLGVPIANGQQNSQNEQKPTTQLLAEEAQKIALKKERERLESEIDNGITTPEQVIDQSQQFLSQALAGSNQTSSSDTPSTMNKGLKLLSDALITLTGSFTPQGTERFAEARARGSARGTASVGLGQAELQEQVLKDQQEFFNKVLRPEPLAGDTAVKVGLLDSGLSSLNAIDDVFQQDPTLLQNFDRPGNPVGQQLSFLRNDLENSLLRIESGAAISESEKKFVRKLTTPQGVKAFLEDPTTTRLKIDSIRQKLSKTRNFIQPNEQLKGFIQAAVQNGFSREEVFSFLRQKGMA